MVLEPAEVAKTPSALDWVRSLFEGQPGALGPEQRMLAIAEALKLLTAAATGQSGAAQILEVLDARELIQDGQVQAAALAARGGLVFMELALKDGQALAVALCSLA